jgi:hypothetical protein
MCRAKTFIEDELCNYVLLFGGDVKRETQLWPKDDDFKALLYWQWELWGLCWTFI